MMCYRDMTFCTAEECKAFNKCPRALTPKVQFEAEKFWGNENVPIAIYTEPKKLECYESPNKANNPNN